MANETMAGAPRIRFATHDGLRVRGGEWGHYAFHWEVISSTGRTYRGDYRQGVGVGWQLDADTARATILREVGESGALRTDDDIAEWLRDMGVAGPGEAIRVLRAVEGMRRFYDRCTADERAALDAYAAGDWDEDTCDECGRQMDTGDDRVCDACESGD